MSLEEKYGKMRRKGIAGGERGERKQKDVKREDGKRRREVGGEI